MSEAEYEYRVVCSTGDDGGETWWEIDAAAAERDRLDDDCPCGETHTVERRDPRKWEAVA
jgi:hypothetical protein